MAERLQRYLARAGVASRRHAEELITAGRVTVNNQVTSTLGSKVEPGDLVALDGKLVMPPDTVSWYVLYKPAGVVTTLDDPQGRPTVRSFLDSVATRVFPIGRLDWDAEGALLLTDDGAAAHRLLHPSFQVPRTYLAKVKGVPTEEGLARLLAGVRLEDGPARALEVQRFSSAERNSWLRVTVGEGRPHLVKRLCAAIGHPVLRLYRPHQAGISVAGMQPGELRPLRPEELAVVEAVAAGQPVPAVTLSLPPRRHGRANDDAETAGDGGEEAGEAGPPRNARAGAALGFRPRPAGGQQKPRTGGARGASPGRGPPREGRPAAAGGGWPRARTGVQRGGPPGRGVPSGRGPQAGRGFRNAPAGTAGRDPGARAGFQPSHPAAGGGPPGRTEGGGGFRGKSAGGARGGPRRGPPGARPGFQHAGDAGRGTAGGFRGKPSGAASGGPRRGPPGGRPGLQHSGGPARGVPADRAARGAFRGKPSGGAWAGARRGPPGGRPGFQNASSSGRGTAGGFRGKPSGPFGGGGRGPKGGRPGFQHAGGPGRGAPAAGGFRGKPAAGSFSGGRRGPPASRPGGKRGPAPGRASRSSAPRGGSWSAPRGAPRGGRGPPRPAGGKPRGPRR